MSRHLPSLGFRCLLAGWLLLGAGQAGAQLATPLEPRPVRMTMPEVSLGFEVEGLYENVNISDSKTVHEQLYLVPLVGFKTTGSVYHPNLLSYDFNYEGGWGWLKDTYTSPGSVNSRDEDEALRRYFLQVDLLDAKPYNASFVAARDHTFRNYDMFNSYEVDTVRYSGHSIWTVEKFEFNADAGWREDQSQGMTDTSDLSETYVSFNGLHRRTTGQSALTYRYSDFENIYTYETPSYTTSAGSVSHTVSASDSETFGSRRQGTTTTGGSYSRYEYSGQQTETVNANEDISYQHNPNLDSFLAAHYSHNSMDPLDSDQFQGTVGLRHHLYESLTSTLDFHGMTDSYSSAYSTSSNYRYGVGVHEGYSKKLGSWGRLSLGGGVVADHENHDSVGTGVRATFGEEHNLYLDVGSTNLHKPTYLLNPRVLPNTIQVTTTNNLTLERYVDYDVRPAGELTEIFLLKTSQNVPDGVKVTVRYSSASLYNAEFDSLNTTAEVRLDLWNTVSLYGRFNWLDNNAPPSALVESLTDLVGGAEFYWRWFRGGAEYETYDSNFSQYESWRLFQNATWQVSSASTLGLDFSESFYSYPGSQHQTRYQALLRYNTQLSYALAWYVEGGYSFQEIVGSDQNLGAARTGLNWIWGKLSLRTGYQFNYQATMTGPSREERDRNYFFCYLKRTF